MGGGCILDCIHEIDLARWYGGEVEEVFCVAGRLSNLEIDTEDYASINFRHGSGTVSEVHLDYLSRTYERGCHIAGETGSILWDFERGEVRHYDADSDQWTTYPHPSEYDVNTMYIEEMRHFLDCIADGTETTLAADEAVLVMHVALAAKRSADSGRFERTGS